MEGPGPGPQNNISTADLPRDKDISKCFAIDHLKLKRLTTMIFIVLIVSSISGIILYIAFWFKLNQLEELTNVYSSFFGFMAANVMNIVGGFCGISTLKAKKRYDKTHSHAVLCLLITGIMFNIVFPTLALVSVDSDTTKRIPTVSLQQCVQNSKLIECTDAENVRTALYCSYIQIILELATVILYWFVWRQITVPVIIVTYPEETVEAVPKVKSMTGAGDDLGGTLDVYNITGDTSASFSEFY